MKASKTQPSRALGPSLTTGRRWRPKDATQQAKAALEHADIVGHVQQERGGLGVGQSRPLWNKETPSERRKLVVLEIRHQEQAGRCAKAVTQARHGALDEMGKHREKEDQLEGPVGNGSKQD